MSGIPLISFERDVWNWVADKHWLRCLCIYVSPVVWEGSNAQLHEEGQPVMHLRGLTTLMKTALWEESSASLSPAEKHMVQLHRQTAARTRVVSMPLKGVHKKLTGYMRGRYIHRQIENYVRLTVDEFNKEYPEQMHPWATLLIASMLERDWRPCRAEYKVYDKEMRTGHMIDIVAVDAKGRLLFIEVKTGYSGGIFVSDISHRWLPDTPFANRGWPCTPKNRAIVQIMLGATMAASNLNLPVGSYRVYVAHVDNLRVEYTEVTRRMLRNEAPGLFHYLRQVREEERIKKKEEKGKDPSANPRRRSLFQ